MLQMTALHMLELIQSDNVLPIMGKKFNSLQHKFNMYEFPTGNHHS